MPFDTHTPIIYPITIVAEFFMAGAFLLNAIAFSAIFFSICRYFQSIIDDLSMIIARANATYWETELVKQRLKQFISLNLECYR